MLKKILKHEFFAVSRMFIPLVVIVLIMTPISAAMLAMNINGSASVWANVIGSLFTFLYVMVLIALSIASFIIIIYRFYKSMVTDEGYLTHTLPVKTSTILWSKCIIAFIWQCITFLVSAFSIVLFTRIVGVWDFNDVKNLWRTFTDALATIDMNGTVLFLEIVILTIVSILYSILQYFVSIAIGQLVKGHRLLGAFGAYIGLTTGVQIITSVLFTFIGIAVGSSTDHFNNPNIAHAILLGICGFLALLCAAYFVLTNYIFKRKLNLE